jgi:hypothetical protein
VGLSKAAAAFSVYPLALGTTGSAIAQYGLKSSIVLLVSAAALASHQKL